MAEVGIIIPDDADLIAITNYVESQRPLINQYRGLQSKIEDYERWYQGLGWLDIHVMINDTLAEAIRRRDEINQLMHNVLSPTSVPADKIGMRPGSASGLAATKPPWWEITIPTWAKVTLIGVPAAILTIVVTGTVRKALWL